MKHLVFYDGECGLCDFIVQNIIKRDARNQFVFAPLQGETAGRFLKDLPDEYKNLETMILIEHYDSEDPKLYVRGKAAFRTFWLLGLPYSLLGWGSFLPAFLYDWGYNLVARNRHRLFSKDSCTLPSARSKDRFLP